MKPTSFANVLFDNEKVSSLAHDGLQPTSNKAFLEFLAGSLKADEYVYTCSFDIDPDDAQNKEWVGRAGKYQNQLNAEDARCNNFFCVATLRGPDQRSIRRRATAMEKMFVLVLDDVGTKATMPTLQATYKLETSPNNYQVGYRLHPPVADVAVATRLLKAMVKQEDVTDPNGANPVRYMRLPYGSNKKKQYGGSFRQVLVEWHPSRAYNLDEICTAFGLDTNFIKAGHPSVVRPNELLCKIPEHLVTDLTDELTRSLTSASPEDVLPDQTAENINTVRQMLEVLQPDNGIASGGNRDNWRNIVWSIASLDWGTAGEHLARTWSQKGRLYDPTSFDSVWNSYDKHRNGIKFGTLVRLSRSAGYSGPLPRNTFIDCNFSPVHTNNKLGTLHPEDVYGDVFNARLFADDHRGKFKYVFSKHQWLKWKGHRWVWCEAEEQMEAAKHTAYVYTRRAASLFAADPTSIKAKLAQSHATKMHDVKRLDAMLRLAASEPEMGVPKAGMLDADPMLLGVQNGVVDLHTGKLRGADPLMLITRQCNASYDPDVPCPTWSKFLLTCFDGDTETVSYVQRALGYTLTGDVSEEVLHFCYGSGRNGKSVMANVLQHIFGDYSLVMRTESLMRSRHMDGPTNDIARLQGARMVLVNETKTEQCIDDARMKELVSTEVITARFLHHEFFEFKPTHKIWMRGNHKPRVADTSDGAWRRLRLLPFEVKICADQVDPDLEKKLLNEKEGILSWLVRGCLSWQSDGLNPSTRVSVASAEYRTESDVLGIWLNEECQLRPGVRTPQRAVWMNYQEWCRQNGHVAGTKNTFTRRLKERGVQALPGGATPFYVGITCGMHA